MFIDSRVDGNVMRFINDSREVPNLEVIYWPPLVKLSY